MWCKKLSQAALVVFTAIFILVINISPGLTQLKYDFFSTDLRFSESTISKAPVVIDGRTILSVSKIDGNPAEERAKLIRDELKNAIKNDNFAQVKIEQQGKLPVLYLLYNKKPGQNSAGEPELGPQQERRYLFTVTKEDTIGQKSNRETAIDLKRDIEQAIARAKRERSSAYIQRQAIIAGVFLFLAVLGTRFLDQLQTYPLRRAIQRVIPGLPSNKTTQPSSLTTLFRLKLGLAQFALWVVTVWLILRLFPVTRQGLYVLFTTLVNTFSASVFSFGGNEFSIIKLLFLIGLLIGAIFLSGYITNLLRTRVLQVTRMTRGSQEIISIITKYGLISISTVVLLQFYGLNLSSLALIGSALGVGIGFGFQDIARNFASGIVLLFERSIQVGDFIQVGEHLGVVEEVRTRSIVLKTLDRISIIVPNSRFLSEEVINWNHRKSISRLHLPIGVAYGSDVKQVKSALLQAATDHLEVLRNPAPQVFFLGFGASSLDLELLVWISDPSRQALIKSDIYFQIEDIFRAQKIDIPFPQRDVNFKLEDLPLNLSPNLENHLIYLLKNLISLQQHK